MSLENDPHFSKALGQFLDAFPEHDQEVIALLAYGLFKNTIRQAKIDGRPVRDSRERDLTPLEIDMFSSKAKAILADYADAQYPEGERTNIEAIQRTEERILNAVLKPWYISLGTILLAPIIIALVAACSTSALQEHVSVFKIFKSLFVGR